MYALQTSFQFPRHGGERAGAGRKRIKPGRPCVPHRARPVHNHAHPVHVTLRARGGLPTFRHAGVLAELRAAIRGANDSPAVGTSFRVVEFSIQHNHAHFIIEAHDKDTLSRGLRGLAIRLARAVNRAMGITGPVWGDRYHARDLKTPRAVRNAIVYVLMNAKKHGERVVAGMDSFSSAASSTALARPLFLTEPVTAPSRTWLGTTGWRRRGLITLGERPRAPA